MDIPVRVSINRKSPDGKNANGPYRDGKEFDSSTLALTRAHHTDPFPLRPGFYLAWVAPA